MYEIIKQVCAGAKELLIPHFCTFCGCLLSENSVLCVECYAGIKPVIPHIVSATGTKSMVVYAAGAYKEPLQNLIRAKAYSNRLASIQLAQVMWRALPATVWEVDMLAPVPLHWTRFAYRGYNQAMVMAGYLSGKTGVPIFTGIKRIKRTPIQTGKNMHERQQNVTDAFSYDFSINAGLIEGKRILLIDDVITTGATLQALAKILYKAKATQVQAAVCARVI